MLEQSAAIERKRGAISLIRLEGKMINEVPESRSATQGLEPQ